jgi:hypothetical protein
MTSKQTERLREKILKKMILTEKEKDIRYLMKIGHWTEEQIRKRWAELEEEQKIKGDEE